MRKLLSFKRTLHTWYNLPSPTPTDLFAWIGIKNIRLLYFYSTLNPERDHAIWVAEATPWAPLYLFMIYFVGVGLCSRKSSLIEAGPVHNTGVYWVDGQTTFYLKTTPTRDVVSMLLSSSMTCFTTNMYTAFGAVEWYPRISYAPPLLVHGEAHVSATIYGGSLPVVTHFIPPSCSSLSGLVVNVRHRDIQLFFNIAVIFIFEVSALFTTSNK